MRYARKPLCCKGFRVQRRELRRRSNAATDALGSNPRSGNNDTFVIGVTSWLLLLHRGSYCQEALTWSAHFEKFPKQLKSKERPMRSVLAPE